ncbi:cadherin-like beta sandwich domain-containing protein [Clostridium sp.]|uniref:cadherin-like beta sandwich domain-containing protein n=1 Tax=Clostridium sp. TaxID=1506 RepID=UPI00284B313B|nr:cadherin-like beta sandwich domain-containing protein [Clostridium sp.]MDR3593453.1 cadherin-like beta sandwich domain-containing protein [Clostridium sp.]
MNKNIKRIIALTLMINAFSTISAITLNTSFGIIDKPVYAASYSPSSDELKTLNIKSTNGDDLDLRDGYNGSTVKLSDDKEYYAKLTDDSDGITIDADAQGEDEVVRIFTSDKDDATEYKPGDTILLGKGDTTIYVRTYASLADYRKAKNQENNVTDCEEEYTINVRKTQASDNEDNTQDPIYLDSIDLSKGDISFLKQTTSYDINVDSSVSEIKITAKPEDESDRVRINGDVVYSSDNYKKTVSLDEGANQIKIKVTDDKDEQRTYTLNITRGDASNTQDDIYLDELKISDGSIDFSKDTNDYNVDVDDAVSKLTIDATPEDDNYVVAINGTEVNSDDNYENEVSLSKGKNTINVVIKDELNDKKRTYTLTVNRGQAQDTQNTNTDTNSNTNATTNPKSKWVQTSAGWQYYDENGNIVKNSWTLDKTNNKWYLVDANGIRLSGWQYTNGKWYMLDSTNGDMKTGWYKEQTTAQSGTNTNTSADTTTSNNTTQIEKWYYLNADGSMKTGWLNDNGKWYYLDQNGQMKKGWVIDSNSKYYLDTDGTMVTGNKTIDGKVYEFTSDGVLKI